MHTHNTHAPGDSLQQDAVSIVIPAYNEEHGIAAVLHQLLDVMPTYHQTYEIIVVDDGSEDSTATVVATVVQQHDTIIHLLRHRNNRGYGASLKTGIRYAHHPLICITDADGTYPNEHIPQLLYQLVTEEYDMVVGARVGDNVAIPLVRRPAKWFVTQLAMFVANEPIPDVNSGLRVFRRDTALRLLNLLPDGFSFTTTITLAMITNSYLIDYIPINYHARVGTSKIKPIRDTINFIHLILRIALYFAPLKLFLPLSGAFLFAAILWGIGTIVLYKRIADVSTLLLAMTGIQIAVIGLLADLIDRRLSNLYRKE